MKTKLIASLLLTAVTLHADLLFDNMSPSADSNSSWVFFWDHDYTFGNSVVYPGFVYAQRFSVLTPNNLITNLGSVSIPIFKPSGQVTSNLEISVVRDFGGLPSLNSEDILEVLAVDPEIPSLSSDSYVTNLGNPTIFNSNIQPSLESQTDYWLVLAPAHYNLLDGSNDATYYWLGATIAGQTLRAVRGFNSVDGLSAWNSVPEDTIGLGFQVYSATIPEPTSSTAVMSSIVGLLILRRKNRARKGPRQNR